MAYYDDGYRFGDYVSVAARRAQALLELAALKKKGRQTSPVVIDGRKIATTFWGEAWCDNLERYSDFASRLPRGRSYARNGSVVDLQVASGNVTALVVGSAMYEVKVTVAPVSRQHWKAVCEDCSGAIDSLVELLQGRLSTSVMTRLCEEKTGLFPSPRDILFTCSCPDWALMCKHVAAVLYGIGARLDHQPELLFTLRNVDQQDLIAKAGSDLSTERRGPAPARVLANEDLSELFGIEMAPAAEPKRAVAAVTTTAPKTPAGKRSPKASTPTRPAKRAKPSATLQAARRSLTPAKRKAISKRVKAYWAARRALGKKR
jgi:uncharacterized Zn finger protein